MPRRLIDISSPLRAGIASDPPHMLPEIDYVDHRQSAPQIAEFFGIREDQLPEGEYAAVERVRISTHNGTHLDAPYHFFSRMNERLTPGGEPSWRIDEVPLDWCWQRGVKLDFRRLPDGHVVGAAEVEAELARIGHVLRPLDIVLVNTAAGARYGETGYVDTGCGMGREATLWLLEQGVRVTGTDGWSWDAPFSHTRRRVAETATFARLRGVFSEQQIVDLVAVSGFYGIVSMVLNTIEAEIPNGGEPPLAPLTGPLR